MGIFCDLVGRYYKKTKRLTKIFPLWDCACHQTDITEIEAERRKQTKRKSHCLILFKDEFRDSLNSLETQGSPEQVVILPPESFCVASSTETQTREWL